MTSGTKLTIAAVIVAGTTGYLAYLGAAESWQYYLTADECLENQHALCGKRLRVSGKVAEETLQDDHSSQQITFALAGTDRALPVVFRGVVPDNMAEGIEVVVEGRLDENGTIRADKLLTKCASKYASEKASNSSKESARESEAETGTPP